MLSMLATLPSTTPEFGVSVERDVVYAQAEGYRKEAPEDSGNVLPVSLSQGKVKPLDLDMDIYLPEDDGARKRPLLLMMHGGSFFIGNKAEKGQVEWCRYFASLGYVAVSINYRLGFHPGKKSYCQAEIRATEDADAALAYLLAREDLRIDPDYIFAAGTSAGAIIALRLAFRPAGNHPRIRAVGNFWGSVQDLSVLEYSDTPILSFQATMDPIMPYEGGYPFKKFNWGMWMFSPYMYGTLAIHQRALELGIRAEHHQYQLPYHRLHLDSHGNLTPVFYEIRDCMAAFFAEEFAEKQIE